MGSSSKFIVHGIQLGTFQHAVNLRNIRADQYENRIAGQIYYGPLCYGLEKDGGLDLFNRAAASVIALTIAGKAEWPGFQGRDGFDEIATRFRYGGAKSPILTCYSTRHSGDGKLYESYLQEWEKNGDVTAIPLSTDGQVFVEIFKKFLTSLNL